MKTTRTLLRSQPDNFLLTSLVSILISNIDTEVTSDLLTNAFQLNVRFFFLSGKRSVPINKTRQNSERKNLQTVHTLTDSLNVFFNREIMKQSRTTPAHSDNENGNLSLIPICCFDNEFNRFFYFFNLLQLSSEIFTK